MLVKENYYLKCNMFDVFGNVLVNCFIYLFMKVLYNVFDVRFYWVMVVESII